MLINIFVNEKISTEKIIKILSDYVKSPYDLTHFNSKLKRKKRLKNRVINIDNNLYSSLKLINRKLKIESIIESIITQTGDELYYGSILFGDKNTWKREVITPVGRIDGLNIKDKKLVELKFVNGWKSALGQCLAYHYYYPDYNPEIWLLLNKKISNKEKETIISVCSLYNMGVNFIDI